MREIHYTERFTYGQLRHALSRLNFEQHTGLNEFNAPIRVFYERPSQLLITIPNRSDETPLEPMYLRIAENPSRIGVSPTARRSSACCAKPAKK